MSDGKKKRSYESSANRIPGKAATFPPDRWDPQAVSKTRPPSGRVHVDADIRSIQGAPSGRSATARPVPPNEQEAREFLGHRFAAAGYEVVADYNLSSPSMLVRLDAYDPNRKVGFHYVSHSDSDVVSDFGDDEEAELRRLDDAGRAHVLVIHDTHVETEVELEALIDDFLARLHKRYS